MRTAEYNQMENDLSRMKEEILIRVAHEFRTPLTVIDSSIKIIEALCSNEISERMQNYLSRIKHNSLRLSRLVNNLVDAGRIASDDVSINLNTIDIVAATQTIIDVVSTYLRHWEVHFDLLSEFQCKLVRTDPEKYEQIILSVLSNAVKYSGDERIVHVRIYTKQEYVCVDIADEGIGIPREKQDMIFELFSQIDGSLTRRAEGSGTGLYIAASLARSLSGKITLESNQGNGSTFTLYIPDECHAPNTSGNNHPVCINDKHLSERVAIEFSDISL